MIFVFLYNKHIYVSVDVKSQLEMKHLTESIKELKEQKSRFNRHMAISIVTVLVSLIALAIQMFDKVETEQRLKRIEKELKLSN
jgi:uncharacterized membrane protein (DUF485 family)